MNQNGSISKLLTFSKECASDGLESHNLMHLDHVQLQQFIFEQFVMHINKGLAELFGCVNVRAGTITQG
jgi:hypothetical protein